MWINPCQSKGTEYLEDTRSQIRSVRKRIKDKRSKKWLIFNKYIKYNKNGDVSLEKTFFPDKESSLKYKYNQAGQCIEYTEESSCGSFKRSLREIDENGNDSYSYFFRLDPKKGPYGSVSINTFDKKGRKIDTDTYFADGGYTKHKYFYRNNTKVAFIYNSLGKITAKYKLRGKNNSFADSINESVYFIGKRIERSYSEQKCKYDSGGYKILEKSRWVSSDSRQGSPNIYLNKTQRKTEIKYKYDKAGNLVQKYYYNDGKIHSKDIITHETTIEHGKRVCIRCEDCYQCGKIVFRAICKHENFDKKGNWGIETTSLEKIEHNKTSILCFHKEERKIQYR